MQTVQILNVTKEVVITQQARFATSLGQRMKGLLGQDSLVANEALILKPCSSIHTFFMRFAIDVLFLDKNMQIVRLVQDMPPNRLSPIVWASKMAIELPAGKISQTNTQVSDKVVFRQPAEGSSS
jgi:uncharacterized membrane protein (UPF0127 family)